MDLDLLRYPLGRFDSDAPRTSATRSAAVERIATLPSALRAAVAGLSDARLDTPYRPGGWTVRQVVHHLADSHMNGFIRLKLALTEQEPTVKPYDEAAWALLPDQQLPVDVSLGIVDGVHARWTALYRQLDEAQFARVFRHPEYAAPMTVDAHLHLYGWHSGHHLAHITTLRGREGW